VLLLAHILNTMKKCMVADESGEIEHKHFEPGETRLRLRFFQKSILWSGNREQNLTIR
jgi:hypothetical protein